MDPLKLRGAEMKQRSSVLSRAGQGTLQSGPSSSASNGDASGTSDPTKSTSSFALTEIKLPGSLSKLRSKQKPQQNNEVDEEEQVPMPQREGEKLLLRGDPAAPLTNFLFNPAQTTSLPSTVKRDIVVAKVQNAAKVHPDSKAAWRRFFGSAENKQLLEDLFWHRYVTEHQDTFEDEAAKFMATKMFTRMSATFVNLFRKTSPRHLDNILKAYPSALSQAVYLAFFVSCPHECVALDGNWKAKLERDISSWCTGMPTRKPSFQSWSVNHFDVTSMDRYPAHVLTRVEKQLQREGVATSRQLQASRRKKQHSRRHSNASQVNVTHDALKLGEQKEKKRPTLPLGRPIRYKEEVALVNSGFIRHYHEQGRDPRGIPPYSYQHVTSFTRRKVPRRNLANGLDAMWQMSDAVPDEDDPSKADSSNQDGDKKDEEVLGEDDVSRPRTYRDLIEQHSNEAWDIIKSYKDSKDKMHLELAQQEQELAQKEAMRSVEEHAIYKSGVHEYSNYLVKQNKSWRATSVERSTASRK